MSEEHDPLLRALASLAPVPSDATREQRVRARCHSAMIQRAGSSPGLLDAVAVAALFGYLSVVLATAARLAGLL